MAIARFLDRMCLALRTSGLWLRYATLQNLIPSFPWIVPPRPPPWCNPRKERDHILISGYLELKFATVGAEEEAAYPLSLADAAAYCVIVVFEIEM